jgi:hypothetical protein
MGGFNFNFEGPEAKKERELRQRLTDLSIQKYQMEVDPEAAMRMKTAQSEAAARQAYDPSASPVAQSVGQRILGENVGYQKIPGTDFQVPTGTPGSVMEQLLGNAVNNVQGLRNVADAETDPTRKRIFQGIADSAEQGLKTKAKELSAADLSFESNVAAGLRYADQFDKTIDKYGTFEMVDPKGSAQLGQIPYQMAIAYAKVADPSSVAREGEVAAAQKYLIPTGLLTRNETAKAAIAGYKKDLQDRLEQYTRISGRKVNIANPYEDQSASLGMGSIQQAQPQQAQQQASQQVNYIFQNGRLVPVK